MARDDLDGNDPGESPIETPLTLEPSAALSRIVTRARHI